MKMLYIKSTYESILHTFSPAEMRHVRFVLSTSTDLHRRVQYFSSFLSLPTNLTNAFPAHTQSKYYQLLR